MATKVQNEAPPIVDDDDLAPAEDGNEAESTGDEDETTKRRTRTAMPFGRPFGLTIKFHNDLNGERAKLVEGILGLIADTADGETLDVHRSTRGDPNENLQTWLIAPYGYEWPESASKERGVRIPQGKLAEMLRKYAAKNNVSIDKAAEMFAEAFGGDAADA